MQMFVAESFSRWIQLPYSKKAAIFDMLSKTMYWSSNICQNED